MVPVRPTVQSPLFTVRSPPRSIASSAAFQPPVGAPEGARPELAHATAAASGVAPPGTLVSTSATNSGQETNRGALSPIYKEGLKAVPGWDQQPGRKAKDEARWHKRLAELMNYTAAGNDWPRHKKTDSDQERTLGIWLHTQRMKHRSRELDQDKQTHLNTLLPGWSEGRTRGRPPRSPNIQRAE